VIMPYGKETRKIGNVADLIQSLIEQPLFPDSIDKEKYLDFSSFWDPVRKVFEIGTLKAMEEMTTTIREKVPNEKLILNSGSRMKIRIHSKDYFRLTGDRKLDRINKGTVVHQIFEKIITKKDVGPVVNQMVSLGLLSASEGHDFFAKIDELLQKEPFSAWFDDGWKVLNERDILRSGESRHRPDRVMIREDLAVVVDYKTGEKSDKDVRQMRGYLNDLKHMGYGSCEGNIWYLQKNEVVKVV